VNVESCFAHPEWQNVAPADNASDIALCTLAAPVDDVPIVPILMGCEAEVLQPGVPVTLVGFGEADDGLGYGPKRSVVTDLKMVGNDAAWIGGNGLSSCYGDSGGPAYVQLDDGSWRVFGATSGSATNDPGCGQTGIWTLVHVYAPWIEQTSGYDVTPCHDADGTWNPGEGCTGFPMAPGAGGGAWPQGCAGELSGASETCGPDPGGGGTSGGVDTDDAGGSDDGGSDLPTGESGADGSTSDDGAGDESGDDDDDYDPGAVDSGLFPPPPPTEGGCACTSAAPRGVAPWLFACIFLVLRRRRVSWRRCVTSDRGTDPRR
jgi:hypothetical protein